MDIKQCRAALEAVIFAHGEPISTARLAETLEMEEPAVQRLAEDLMQEYGMRKGGIRLLKLDDTYQFCTEQQYATYVRKAMDIRRNVPLSQAALEVLAIVAYNQPVTRAFIEQVRGVDCDAVVQGLVGKGLIEEKGRLELPGHPLLYGTTVHFLRSFSLSSLDQLPPLPEKEGEAQETTLDEMIVQNEQSSQAVPETADGEEPETSPDSADRDVLEE